MGLIRKTLMVGSVGVVKGSSKKQRVAKATMKASQATQREAEAQAAAMTAAARAANAQAAANEAAAAAAIRLAEEKAAEEREFRYATDPAYRKFIDDKRAAEEAA